MAFILFVMSMFSWKPFWIIVASVLHVGHQHRLYQKNMNDVMCVEEHKNCKCTQCADILQVQQHLAVIQVKKATYSTKEKDTSVLHIYRQKFEYLFNKRFDFVMKVLLYASPESTLFKPRTGICI